MGRLAAIIAFLVAFFTGSIAWPQHKVTLTKEEVKKYKLPESSKDTYMVYSFKEYKGLKKDLKKLESFNKQIKLLQDENKILQENISKSKKIKLTLEADLNSCVKSRKRLFDKWEDCDEKLQYCKAGSWKPWIYTAVAAAVAVVGTSLAVYYGYKYNKAK